MQYVNLGSTGLKVSLGASRMPHLDDAVASLDVSLSDEECRFLEEPYRPQSADTSEWSLVLGP